MVAGAHLLPFERDLAEVTPRFRVGFLAALRSGFLAPAAVFVVFRFVVFVDGFFAADAFFDAFFFGDADAGFAFRLPLCFVFLLRLSRHPRVRQSQYQRLEHPRRSRPLRQRQPHLGRSQWCQ